MDREQIIKEYFSNLAKQSHIKSPRGEAHFKMMAEKRWGKTRLTKKTPCDKLKDEEQSSH
jgi:hypothetical protein